MRLEAKLMVEMAKNQHFQLSGGTCPCFATPVEPTSLTPLAAWSVFDLAFLGLLVQRRLSVLRVYHWKCQHRLASRIDGRGRCGTNIWQSCDDLTIGKAQRVDP